MAALNRSEQPAHEPGTLLERDHELDAIDGVVAAARAGEPAVALIEGPPGIGKSRLLAHAHDTAAATGFRVLTARGSDLERELPYGIVRQLLEPLLLAPDGRLRLLAGPAQAAARVFEPLDPDADPTQGNFAVLHGLYWLVANLASEGPVCLSIDDLHWADPASLRFVAYLGRRLDGLGVLIVGATRPGEPEAESRLIWEIAQDPAARSVRLSPLSEDAASELVRSRLGAEADPVFCAVCHRATGGNPLLLGELLKALRAEGIEPDAAHASAVTDIGPRAVTRTVLLRLARLPPDAAVVARTIAVLGDGAGLAATAALAGLDETRTAEATRALVAAEILRPAPEAGFVHALVRDAVYSELSRSERELEHERAARVLAEVGAAPEIVAGHLLAVPARAEQWVAGVLLDAARLATRRGDSEATASYLRRALDERAPAQDRTALLLELGAVESLVDIAAAIEHLREAHELLEDPLQRAMAAELLARGLMLVGAADEMTAVARTARIELADRHRDQQRALAAIEIYGVSCGADVPDAAPRAADARADGVPDRMGAKMLAAAAAWQWALDGGTAGECSDFARAVLADGALIGRDPGLSTALLAGVLVLADDDEPLRIWDTVLDIARQHGSMYAICTALIYRGWTWLERGELAEAQTSLAEAHQQTFAMLGPDGGVGAPYAAAHLARVLIERGELDKAAAVLESGGSPPPASDGAGLLHRARTELALARREWEQALVSAGAYRASLRNVDNPAWAPWRSLQALALDGLGPGDEACVLAEQELEAARRWGAPGAIARALRVLGTLRRDDGHALLREAAAAAEDSPARLEHAKALVALGSALRRAGHRAEARDPLRRGLELAGRCGAAPLAEQARTELYSAGGRPRRTALSGPASLTPSERRIAELAAEGDTNRDIAQTLYVTPKTVEVHLTSVYRKLGISTRAKLSAALAPDAA